MINFFKLLLICFIFFQCSYQEPISLISNESSEEKKQEIKEKKNNFVIEKKNIEEPKKNISIIKKYTESLYSGSLTDIDDPRNRIFVNPKNNLLGQILNIKFFKEKKFQNEEKQKNKDDKIKTESERDFLSDFLEKYPELKPSEKNQIAKNLKLLNSLPMEVIQEYPDGHVLVSYKRESKSEIEDNEIDIKAEIPYQSLSQAKELTEEDLRNVVFISRDSKEKISRKSDVWEPEYTLRVSGFSEALSLKAEEIRNASDDLKKISLKIKDQLASMGQERQTMAKERDKLLGDFENQKEELKTKEKEIEDLRSKLDLESNKKSSDENKNQEQTSNKEKKPDQSNSKNDEQGTKKTDDLNQKNIPQKK